MASKISIIIPTFDRPAKLERALRSCLSQSQCPLEILVVDNGENPQTKPTVESAASKTTQYPIKYITSKKFDIRQALAKGIETAAGEWLILLDDDDFLLLDRIEKDSRLIENSASDSILLLQDFLRVDYNNRLMWEHRMGHKEMGIDQALTLDSFPPPPAATWRTEIAKAHHSYHEPNGGTDFDLYASLLPYGKIVKTNSIGYVMDDTRVAARLTTSASHMLEMVEQHRIRFKKHRHLAKLSGDQIDKRLDQQQAFFAAKELGLSIFFDSEYASYARQNPKETFKGILAPLRKQFSKLFGKLLPEMRGSKTYTIKQYSQLNPSLSQHVEDSMIAK